ncbi:hypothetical protein [Parerythrobacter aestuarii]|uniref:hypothetical protein n=1 Tax=Parerythrobacter aestuarii TaxID=3020909 RepID=UPI0024DEBE6D|nr:hypothetical protein [Parerythrobacter aestuarii]
MNTAFHTKIAAGSILLCASSPALAYGSGLGAMLAWYLAPIVIGAILVIATVKTIRNRAKANGRNADAISAILLAICFTPTTFFDRWGNGNYAFEIFPAWVLIAFGESFSILFFVPLIAIAIGSGLFYVILVLRRDVPNGFPDSEAP